MKATYEETRLPAGTAAAETPVEMALNETAVWKRIAIKSWTGMELLRMAGANRQKRNLFVKVWPNTMVSPYRLENVYGLATAAEDQGMPGAFVECGVWKGGCSAVMASVAKNAGHGRKTWLFDSFEGLPEPSPLDGVEAALYAGNHAKGRLQSIARCVGPLDVVKELFFTKLQIDPSNVEIRKGWFQDTLPEARHEIGPIALLRLDSDWYESEKECLNTLFDLVIPGGFVILDDYGYWAGCHRAIHEFLDVRQLRVNIMRVDESGAYFQKPTS